MSHYDLNQRASNLGLTEGWGFICLIICLMLVSVSLTMLTGTPQIVGCLIGASLGVLAGGLYAASVKAGARSGT